MINEVAEVRSYLDGDNIDKKNLYRICFLLAKWFKEQGMNNIDIRKEIFEWGKKNGVYIKYNVNSIIYNALEDKTRLKDNITVKINESDVKEIKSRFDSKNTRLTALAMLCYAKAYSDSDGCFGMSSVALSSWIKIDGGNLSKRHIQELIDFGFITKVTQKNKKYSWTNNDLSNMYKINTKLHNSGCYVLNENDIHDLYSVIFK